MNGFRMRFCFPASVIWAGGCDTEDRGVCCWMSGTNTHTWGLLEGRLQLSGVRGSTCNPKVVGSIPALPISCESKCPWARHWTPSCSPGASLLLSDEGGVKCRGYIQKYTHKRVTIQCASHFTKEPEPKQTSLKSRPSSSASQPQTGEDEASPQPSPMKCVFDCFFCVFFTAS